MSISLDISLKLKGFELGAAFSSTAEFLVIFGPSGSGKSLTLRTLAGLEREARGNIQVGNDTWLDTKSGINLTPQKRSIGCLFQDYALFPHKSVTENMAFGLGRGIFGKVPKAEKEWIGFLLDSLALNEHKHKYVGELSGGQKQRVALGRALAIRPKLLLLDEPFSALDRELRHGMREDLKAIRKSFGIPAVLVTHDMEDVTELADEMIVMEKGGVKRSWAFRSLCRHRRVADFVSNHGPVDKADKGRLRCAAPA